MPASCLRIARSEAILQVDGWNSAFGSVGQNESRKEKTGAEEVDANGVEYATMNQRLYLPLHSAQELTK